MIRHRSVCLVAASLSESNMRLQPWRYLSEVVAALRAEGHRVTIISDAQESSSDRLHVDRVVSSQLWRNRTLFRAIDRVNAQVTLWHVGLASFLYQRYPCTIGQRNIGIFTSPIYTLSDFQRIGLRKTLQHPSLSGVHLATALMPRALLRARMPRSGLDGLVVQTQTVYQQLRATRLWPHLLRVIPPGLDDAWMQTPPHHPAGVRQVLGLEEKDRVILYIGSPAPLRGLPVLIQAFRTARQHDSTLKLVILSRRRKNELNSEARKLQNRLASSALSPHVRLVDGFLSQQAVRSHIAAADVVALPFELVPSDAPLSLLEAAALGKPVITTALACLPEMVPPHLRFLAAPSDPASLAQQILYAVHAPIEPRSTSKTFRNWQQVGKEWSRFIEELP